MRKAERRKRGCYFARVTEDPAPVSVTVERRISFSDVDLMGILWHGRYALLFEQANEELGRRCGMTYQAFMDARLRAPIVQFHVDYFASPVLAETVTIVGRLIWNEGARMNIEYEIWKADGSLAATGYTVQMFVDEHGEPQLVSPPLLEQCRNRWVAGEFADMQ